MQAHSAEIAEWSLHCSGFGSSSRANLGACLTPWGWSCICWILQQQNQYKKCPSTPINSHLFPFSPLSASYHHLRDVHVFLFGCLVGVFLFCGCPTTYVTPIKHFRESHQNPLSVNVNSRNNKKSKKCYEKCLPLRTDTLQPQWVCAEGKRWVRVTRNQRVVWNSVLPVWHSFLSLSLQAQICQYFSIFSVVQNT